MKIKFIGKYKVNEFASNRSFVEGKEYEVLADYRARRLGYKISDDGFVIVDENREQRMVSLNDFIISDSAIGETFVFKNKK